MKAVNLLPNDQRGAAKVSSPATAQAKASAGDGFGAYLLLGALAIAVIAVAAMVLTNNTISERQADLAKTQAQVQAVSNQAASLKPYADFKQLADARVQTVQSLATTRFDWEQTLRDLSRALPRDARLSSLKGTVRGSGAAAAASTASPNIEIAGCTGSQTSVAKLMARLRAVRGVTRVALKSSAKAKVDAPVAGAAPAAGGAAQEASLCGKGAKPTFGLTIYFERFGVPAVSAPAGAAATAGPTGPTGATAPATPAPGTTPATPAAPGSTPATPQAASSTNSATQGVSTP
jgi:Tfp pilus assembly protein PilN